MKGCSEVECWRTSLRTSSMSGAALAVALIMPGFSATGETPQEATLQISPFSAMPPGTAFPTGWNPSSVAGVSTSTRYAMVDDGGRTVLRADAARSASGLTNGIRVNPADWPLLKWSWKVSGTIPGGKAGTRDGDDYPARLYVMFDLPLDRLTFTERTKMRIARALHGPELPAATLCYVWDTGTAAGSIVPSAYTSRVQMIVVESGTGRVGQWVTFERDLQADFRKAFGQEPPAVSGIAVAADTDNTGGSVTAYFGDISLHKRAVSR
jgi:hypothetical protein